MVRLTANSVLFGVVGSLFLGCSQWLPQVNFSGPEGPVVVTHHNKPAACDADSDPDQNVKLDLIRQLMGSGKLYAALAHLESTRSNSLQSTYLRAEILRQTYRTDQAVTLYHSLIGGCMEGKGFHGLGLIAGRESKVSEAIGFLQKAARALPIDIRVRNDLGYALMLGGQYDAARNEFLTSLELDGSDPLAATNMVLLLLVTGKEHELQAFTEHMNINSQTVAHLRAQAEGIEDAIGFSPP